MDITAYTDIDVHMSDVLYYITGWFIIKQLDDFGVIHAIAYNLMLTVD